MASTSVPRAEIQPGMILRSTRWSELLILSAPNSRGMVRCETYDSTGTAIVVVLPYKVIRWL